MPDQILLPDQSVGANAERVLRAYRIILCGRVQGLGVRPAIARLAQEVGVAGFVANCSLGVVIHAEGPPPLVEAFRHDLSSTLPRGVRLEHSQCVMVAPAGLATFRIDPTNTRGRLSVNVPPDIAVCPKCLAEVADSENRRFKYIFATCTQCGPRYSMIRSMPYDREGTGMESFDQCFNCRNEYVTPTDRRFHSQTNSCPECGPRLWLSDAAGLPLADREVCLEYAAKALCQHTILAIRGIGGYQLIVDATSPAAVEDLRRRKQRLGKPLAVMVQDLHAANQLAILSAAECFAMADASNPIVVAPLREPSLLDRKVTEGLNTIGMMLPTTALHDYLAKSTARPLVVTSGNLEAEPLAFDAATATQELLQAADLFLHHDRPILKPIDDSVVRVIAGRPTTVRLARGLAPLPLRLDSDRPILALGGHQKAAIALSNGVQAVLGPHVGDLENEATRVRYLAHVKSMCNLYDMEPEFLVHDLHPDYFTSRWAGEQSLATIAVQHHHAHVAAGMLENQWLDRRVLGVAWDGTGYGTDGTIWGSEFLLATVKNFERIGHLRPFILPGGDAAVRQPWRVAVSLVHQALGAEAASRLAWPEVPPQQIAQLVRLMNRPQLWPQTTSAGRLFDGIAALVIGITAVQFEGQGAMLLESNCQLSAGGEYRLPISDGEPAILDWRPLVVSVLADLAAGVSAGTIAMKFHRALAFGILALAAEFNELPMVLSGGCFNNRILTEQIAERFDRRGQQLGLPGTIPVNDGGLAAGQLAVAIAKTKQNNRTSKGG